MRQSQVKFANGYRRLGKDLLAKHTFAPYKQLNNPAGLELQHGNKVDKYTFWLNFTNSDIGM